MRALLFRAVPALVFLGCHVNIVRGQSIGDISAIPRLHGPGGHAYMNDQPYSHRYNYGGTISNGNLLQFYLNGDGRQLWHQDYLDRVDRAEKFGYQMPHRPLYGYPPHYDRPRLFHGGGIGFGLFKRY